MAKETDFATRAGGRDKGLNATEEDFVVPRSRIGGYARYGMSAGVVSGMLAALVGMIASGFTGDGFWMPLYSIAAGWFGPRAMLGGTVMGLLGAFTLLIVAMVWGACYGMIVGLEGVDAKPFSVLVTVGLLLGLMSWFVITYFVLPWGNPVMEHMVARAPVRWFLGHVLFGAFLALTPILLKSEDAEKAREPDPRMV
jgi:hypothetical protein